MTPEQHDPRPADVEVDDLALDDVEEQDLADEEADDEPAPPSDDLPRQAWITIGLFVLIGIIFATVCVPLFL